MIYILEANLDMKKRRVYNSAGHKKDTELLILNYGRNINNNYFLKYKGVYFLDNNGVYELVLPTQEDFIHSVPNNYQLEYEDDDKLTIGCIDQNNNYLNIGNSINQSTNNIDDLIIRYEASIYNI